MKKILLLFMQAILLFSSILFVVLVWQLSYHLFCEGQYIYAVLSAIMLLALAALCVCGAYYIEEHKDY